MTGSRTKPHRNSPVRLRAVRMITNGVVDRTVQNWIADEHSRSTVKNTNAVLVRVMEQVVRDGMIKVNLARVTGWQRLYMQAEDKLLSPRALAVPDWETLVQLADALVAASYELYGGCRRRPFRCVHCRTNRRSVRMPRRGHRHQPVDLDRAAPDRSRPR